MNVFVSPFAHPEEGLGEAREEELLTFAQLELGVLVLEELLAVFEHRR